jgi:hypothetical protein
MTSSDPLLRLRAGESEILMIGIMLFRESRRIARAQKAMV